MVPPLEIVYHDFARSEALERHIREQAGELAEVCPDIRSCRVTLEPSERCGCQVCLELSVQPGEEMMALRNPGRTPSLFGVVDALFGSVKTQLGQRAASRRMEILSAL